MIDVRRVKIVPTVKCWRVRSPLRAQSLLGEKEGRTKRNDQVPGKRESDGERRKESVRMILGDLAGEIRRRGTG